MLSLAEVPLSGGGMTHFQLSQQTPLSFPSSLFDKARGSLIKQELQFRVGACSYDLRADCKERHSLAPPVLLPQEQVEDTQLSCLV